MPKVRFLWAVLWSTFSTLQVHALYYMTLSNDGPVVLGGTITFKADLFSDSERPSGSFVYKWNDRLVQPHVYETPETSNTTTYWSVNYSRENAAVGRYMVEVGVWEYNIFHLGWHRITGTSGTFDITEFMNGNLSVSQFNKTLEDTFVSTATEANMTIDIRKGDYDFLVEKATSLTSYWFIDCKYFGESSELSFQYNFTNPNVSHNIDTLVVASYEPPTTVPPPTTTTLPTTTTTTTVAPANTTGSNITSSPLNFTSISTSSTTVAPQTTAAQVTTKFEENTGGTTVGNVSLPFICSNSSIVPIDPNKTYGHFSRKVDIRAPISNISVEGTNWIKPWEMLSLNVSCKGSGPLYKCLHFYRGKYNVTGNETCDNGDHLHTCNFSIIHYFLEPSVYTILIILNNDVSKQIYPLTINIYKVTKKPQLSVIVVPVSCTLAAVVPIVFGVAYYIQSRARFNVEVADFHFGQNNPDMEYKTFRERLRDSFNNAINPGNKRISGYEPLSNPQTLQ